MHVAVDTAKVQGHGPSGNGAAATSRNISMKPAHRMLALQSALFGGRQMGLADGAGRVEVVAIQA